MNEVLIDTDMLSLFLRNQPEVLSSAQQYLEFHNGFTFSVLTHFEILRGLRVKDASAQIDKFRQICEISREINLSPEIIIRASDIYAELHKTGSMIGDADILIAATAMQYGIAVVTNNESHFARISGLQVLNWNR